MAIKKINTDLQIEAGLLDGDGNSGNSNQILISTGTGIDWVDGSGSGIIGGPYLPLSAGSSYPLTGDLYLGTFNKISGVTNDNLVIGVDINNSSGASSFDIQMDGSTSAFYINNSRNVGIGTTSPNGKLTVVSNNAYNSGGGLRLQSSGGADRTLLYLSTDHTNQVSTIQSYRDGTGAGVKNLLINPQGGNVGIGTTNPITKLQVTGSAYVNNGTLFLDTNQFLKWGNSNQGIKAVNDGNMSFVTGSNERVTITSAGNVGIGTTNPGAKLQLGDYPNDNIDITTYPDVPSEHMIHLTAPETTNRYGGGISFGENAFTAANITVQDAGGGGSLNMLFGTRHTSGTVQERMRITSAGDVGIGMGSPTEKLQVYEGGLTAYKTYTATNAGAILTAYQSTFSPFTKTTDLVAGSDSTVPSEIRFLTRTNGASTIGERMRITSAGNVGIGTTNMYARLNVKATSHNNGISVNRAADNTAALYIGNDGGGTPIFAANNADMIFGKDFSGTFTETMRLTNGGNLGIGTTSPVEKLDVVGNIKLSGTQYVSKSSSANITPVAGDWIDIAYMPYGEHHGMIALEWNGIAAPSCCHHGWAQFSVGTYYSSSFNYGQDTYVELVKAHAHNDLWLEAVRAVDTGSYVRIQVKFSRTVVSGSFVSYVLSQGQGTITPYQPYVNNNSYTVLANANVGKIDGEEVQKAFANPVRFSGKTSFDDNVGIGTTNPSNRLQVSGGSIGIDSEYMIRDNRNNTILLQSASTAASNRSLTIGNATYSNVIVPNGNVGIGTTSPTQLLHVYSNTSNPTGIGVQNNQRYYSVRSNNYSLVFADETVGAERMTISHTGNVGIGTTSPLVKLQVYGNPMPAADDAASVEDMLTLYRSGSQTVWAGGASLSLGRYSAGGSSPKSRLDFKLKAAAGSNTALPELTVMTMNSDGRVGIGTTAPGAKLDIYDTLTKTAANPNTVEVFHAGNVAGNGIYPVAGLFTQRVSGGSNSYATGLVGVADKLGDYGYIARGVQGIGKLSGNITVNNADMQYMGVEGRIEMEGSNSVNLDDRAYSFYGTAEIDSGSHLKEYHGLYLNTPTNNGTILNKYGVSQVDANSKNYFAGNVGIGTTDPDAKLDVDGTSLFRRDLTIYHKGNNSAPSYELRFKGTNSSGVDKVQASLESSPYATDTNAGTLLFKTANASNQILDTRMVIDGIGNVGIGTTSPGTKLHISESSSASTVNLLYLENTGSGGSEGVSIKFNPMFGATSMIASNREGADSGKTNLTFHNCLVNDAAPIERMRITSAGNVGIGTTSPNGKLEVNGIVKIGNATTGLSMNGGSATEFLISGADTGGNAWNSIHIKADGNDGLFIEKDTNKVGIGTSNPTDKLHVGGSIKWEGVGTEGILSGGETYVSISSDGDDIALTGGNVGIGTTSPARNLHIHASALTDIHITNDDTGSGSGDGGTITMAALDLLINNREAANIQLRTSGTERMRITSGGNVGIGTTNPGSYKLKVAGVSDTQGLVVGYQDLLLYDNNTYSPEFKMTNNTHSLGIDYQNNETLRFITRSGVTTVPITFAMRTGTINAAAFTQTSDERLKTKITDLSCDNINVSWKSFEMKDNEGEKRVGVIAQELEKSHPEYVNTNDEGFKSVKYIDLLIAKIAELEARLEKIENQ